MLEYCCTILRAPFPSARLVEVCVKAKESLPARDGKPIHRNFPCLWPRWCSQTDESCGIEPVPDTYPPWRSLSSRPTFDGGLKSRDVAERQEHRIGVPHFVLLPIIRVAATPENSPCGEANHSANCGPQITSPCRMSLTSSGEQPSHSP